MMEPTLVIYYERVSTLHVEQDESMENQRALAQSYLRRHPELTLAEPLDTYSERESGKSDSRPKYQQLLERLSKGDIRYLLIKDFKRLNRSVELSAQLRNHARKFNYKFILLSTGQIYDPNTNEQRMLYNFEAIVNEEVVHRQSEYGRLAHRQKCEAKKLNQNNVTFGFSWDKEAEDIIIDPEKSSIVKELFYRYVFQGQGITELRKYLATLGLQYSANTITKWLQETAYIGIFHLNKKGSELGVGAGQKTKRFINPKDEWIEVHRPDLAFIDKEVFDLAQRLRESRQRFYSPDKNGVLQSRFKGIHLFSSKIYCGECGYPFVHCYADRKQTVPIYRDVFNTRSRDPLAKCANTDHKRIYESDMKDIVSLTVNNIVQEQRSYFPMLLDILEKVLRENNTHQSLINEKIEAIKRLTKEGEKILSSFPHASGALLSDLNERYNQIQLQIATTNDEIAELENILTTEDEITQRMAKIQEAVSQWECITPDMLSRSMVNSFISKIIVHKDGIIEIILNTTNNPSIQISNKDIKENRIAGSPFSMSATNSIDGSTYAALINRIRHSYSQCTSSNMPFFSFNYTESRPHQSEPLTILVEFELSLS